MHLSSFKKITVAISAVAMCASSTGAIASTSYSQASISPLVALSALGSQASRIALCGSQAAAAAAAAATAQGAPAPCVLPVTDAAAPPPMVESAPPPPPEMAPPMATAGYHIPLVLLGLVGIVLAAVLIHAFDEDDDEDNSPT